MLFNEGGLSKDFDVRYYEIRLEIVNRSVWLVKIYKFRKINYDFKCRFGSLFYV